MNIGEGLSVTRNQLVVLVVHTLGWECIGLHLKEHMRTVCIHIVCIYVYVKKISVHDFCCS